MNSHSREQRLSTVMMGYLLGVVSELEARGVDAPDLLQCAGVSNPLSNDPLNRFPDALISNVFRLGMEATQDQYFGLHAARCMKASDFHVLGLGLMSSGSMLSLAQRLCSFIPLISGSGSMQIVLDQDAYKVVTATPLASGVEDSWLSLTYKLLGQINPLGLTPLRVEMMHAKPRSGADVYEEHFAAPVTFGHGACALVFEKKAFERPLRSGCEDLACELDARALAYMAKVKTGDILARVQNAIMECLEDEDAVTLDAVVARVRLSARQIRQHLAERGTTFQRVMDDTRLILAHRKLRDRRMPITEVAYAVGFSDSANFTRAFKRWTGQTPFDYRERLLARGGANAK